LGIPQKATEYGSDVWISWPLSFLKELGVRDFSKKNAYQKHASGFGRLSSSKITPLCLWDSLKKLIEYLCMCGFFVFSFPKINSV
jgi:hypothetical protein